MKAEAHDFFDTHPNGEPATRPIERLARRMAALRNLNPPMPLTAKLR